MQNQVSQIGTTYSVKLSIDCYQKRNFKFYETSRKYLWNDSFKMFYLDVYSSNIFH